MYILYNLLLVFLAIIFSPIILISFLLKPKFRAGFWQKIGFYPKLNSDEEAIWFHAVSVGEVNAVENLIKKTRTDFPDKRIVLSTVTKTGREVAKNKLSKFVNEILYFPYDFKFSVNSAIKAINPKSVIIAETEIWPNFSFGLKGKNIPLILVNGRISPSSYKGYKKFSFFFRQILENYSLILMQTEDDKKRIINIGANPNTVEVMGNLKFDISNVLVSEEINSLKESLSINKDRVLIAGSTHSGEDEIVINVFQRLKKEFADIKLLLAPRHPERNPAVLNLISKTGEKFGLRSKNSNFKDAEIILLDTMGELSRLYSVSYTAFIGGSFSGTGGHNPLEPAIYGIPVISGPTVFNFKDIYAHMTENGSAIVVPDEDKFFKVARDLFLNKEKYQEASQACKDIFEANKGALDLALERLKTYID